MNCNDALHNLNINRNHSLDVQTVSNNIFNENYNSENTFINIGELLSLYTRSKLRGIAPHSVICESTLFTELTLLLLNEKNSVATLRAILKPYVPPENSKLFYFELILFLERHGAYAWMDAFQSEIDFPWISPTIQICAYYVCHRSSFSYSDLQRQLLRLTKLSNSEWNSFWVCFKRFSQEKNLTPSSDCSDEKLLLQRVKTSSLNSNLINVSLLILFETIRRGYLSHTVETLFSFLSQTLEDLIPFDNLILESHKNSLPVKLQTLIAQYKPQLQLSEWVNILLSCDHPIAQSCARSLIKKMILAKSTDLEVIVSNAPQTAWPLLINELYLSKSSYIDLLSSFLNRFHLLSIFEQETLLKWTKIHSFEELKKLDLKKTTSKDCYNIVFNITFEKLLSNDHLSGAAQLCLEHIGHIPFMQIEQFPLLIQNAVKNNLADVIAISDVIIECSKHFASDNISFSNYSINELIDFLKIHFSQHIENRKFSSALVILKVMHKLLPFCSRDSLLPALLLKFLYNFQKHRLHCESASNIRKELDTFLANPDVMLRWTENPTMFFKSLKIYLRLSRSSNNPFVMNYVLRKTDVLPSEDKIEWIDHICRQYNGVRSNPTLVSLDHFKIWFKNHFKVISRTLESSGNNLHISIVKYAQASIDPKNIIKALKADVDYVFLILQLSFLFSDTRQWGYNFIELCLDIHIADLYAINKNILAQIEQFYPQICQRDPTLAQKLLIKLRSGNQHSKQNQERCLDIIHSWIDKGCLNEAMQLADENMLIRYVKDEIIKNVSETTLDKITPPLLKLITDNISILPIQFQFVFFRYLLHNNPKGLLLCEREFTNLIHSLNHTSFYLLEGNLPVTNYFLINGKDKSNILLLIRTIEQLTLSNSIVNPASFRDVFNNIIKYLFANIPFSEFLIQLAIVCKVSNFSLDQMARVFLSIDQLSQTTITNRLFFCNYFLEKSNHADIELSGYIILHAIEACNSFACSKTNFQDDIDLNYIKSLVVKFLNMNIFLEEIDFTSILLKIYSNYNPDDDVAKNILQLLHKQMPGKCKAALREIIRVHIAETPPDYIIHCTNQGLLDDASLFVEKGWMSLGDVNEIFLPVFEKTFANSKLPKSDDMPLHSCNNHIYLNNLVSFFAANIDVLNCRPQTGKYFTAALAPWIRMAIKYTPDELSKFIKKVLISFENKKTLIEGTNCKVYFCSMMVQYILNLVGLSIANKISEKEENYLKIIESLHQTVIDQLQNLENVDDFDYLLNIYIFFSAKTFNPVMKIFIDRAFIHFETSSAGVNRSDQIRAKKLLFEKDIHSRESQDNLFLTSCNSLTEKLADNECRAESSLEELKIIANYLPQWLKKNPKDYRHILLPLRKLFMALLKHQHSGNSSFFEIDESVYLFKDTLILIRKCLQESTKNIDSKVNNNNLHECCYFSKDLCMFLYAISQATWLRNIDAYFEISLFLIENEYLILTTYSAHPFLQEEMPEQVKKLMLDPVNIKKIFECYGCVFSAIDNGNIHLDKLETLLRHLHNLELTLSKLVNIPAIKQLFLQQYRNLLQATQIWIRHVHNSKLPKSKKKDFLEILMRIPSYLWKMKYKAKR